MSRLRSATLSISLLALVAALHGGWLIKRPAVALFFDDFNRADAASLGNGWTMLFGTPDINIVSNQAQETVTANDHVTIRPATPAFPNNQYAKAIVKAIGAGNMAITVRAATDGDGYAMANDSASGQVQLWRLDNGVPTVIDSAAATQFQVDDGIEVRATGSSISGLINDVEVVSATDATYASGVPSFYFGSAGTSQVFAIDDFEAGRL